jgi:alkylhydroperoxidase family enzyme
MARLPYATQTQLAQLMHRSGLPENTPAANAFRMLAHSPNLGGSTLRLVLALLTETVLDPKLRELVILRTGHRCDGPYAWVQHVAIARQVGVSDAQIAALERGETPRVLFNQRERTALAFADEVLDTCNVADAPFEAVRGLFSSAEVVELLVLIGYFRMICGLMTTLEVGVESPFGAKVLDSVRDAVA